MGVASMRWEACRAGQGQVSFLLLFISFLPHRPFHHPPAPGRLHPSFPPVIFTADFFPKLGSQLKYPLPPPHPAPRAVLLDHPPIYPYLSLSVPQPALSPPNPLLSSAPKFCSSSASWSGKHGHLVPSKWSSAWHAVGALYIFLEEANAEGDSPVSVWHS